MIRYERRGGRTHEIRVISSIRYRVYMWYANGGAAHHESTMIEDAYIPNVHVGREAKKRQ